MPAKLGRFNIVQKIEPGNCTGLYFSINIP
jgi:hypothetical protein